MIGPLVQGSTRPIWSFTVVQDDNTPFVLTGATFTGVLYDRRIVGSKKTLTPANFAIVSASAGTFTYTPVAGDVDTPGEWEIEMVTTITAQPTYLRDHVTILEAYT